MYTASVRTVARAYLCKSCLKALLMPVFCSPYFLSAMALREIVLCAYFRLSALGLALVYWLRFVVMPAANC